ncbi:MAG: AAA family ATPase, partial [Bacteroidetes bacterium]|nr:AAA family ATPase [Bacteroidota bacterium]
SESKERLEQWKEKLLDALGSNGQIVIDILPEVELIIGKQPNVPVLGPDASRNRFNMVMEQFVNTFSRKNHPLVIFLDDVQWSDSAGFEIMEKMATSPIIKHLLLIFAYRDNEATLLSPLTEVKKNIKKQNIPVREISLQPLNVDDVRDFLASFMKCNITGVVDLAELVCQKTGGNPFFVIQFVKTLYKNKLLIPGLSKEWVWDEDAITQLQVTDNVVELMADKINRLDKKTTDILKVCACMGNRFELESLVSLTDKTVEIIIAGLEEAALEGLIVRTSYYMFQHDRIQEAVYSLLTNDEKEHYHYMIGKTALAKANNYELKNRIFFIVNQLNLGSGLISDETEKRKIAKLNLEAGIKAKASSAYMPALNYFKTGISMLLQESWATDYELRLNLEIEAAEASYLSNKFDQMDFLIDSVIAHSRSGYEKARILEIKVQGLIAQSMMADAAKTGVHALRLLGVRLPENPGKLQIIFGLIKIKLTLLGKKIEDLADLPQMANPDKQLAMRILLRVGFASFLTRPNLLPLCIFQILKLSIKYGNSPFASSAYASYGLLLCGITGEIDMGNKFGALAMDLLENPETKPDRSKTLFIVNHFIVHWKTQIKNRQKHILEGYFVGVETGDLESAGVCAHV